jgi:hypothetical protein
MGNDEEVKKRVKEWWQISMMQAHGNLSHNMASA